MNDYQAEFHRIKEKYAGKIELYLGLEIDYLMKRAIRLLPVFVNCRWIIASVPCTCCIMNGAKWWMWMFRPMFSGR